MLTLKNNSRQKYYAKYELLMEYFVQKCLSFILQDFCLAEIDPPLQMISASLPPSSYAWYTLNVTSTCKDISLLALFQILSLS